MTRRLCGLLFVLTGLAGCSVAPEQSRSLSASDITAIKSIDDRFRELIVTQDWNTLASIYADQAVLMPPQAGVIAGPRAIVEWFARAGMAIQEFTGRSEAIGGSVDMALNRGSYALVYTTGASPDPVREFGKYLWVLRRQPDNSWRITTHIWNTTGP